MDKLTERFFKLLIEKDVEARKHGGGVDSKGGHRENGKYHIHEPDGTTTEPGDDDDDNRGSKREHKVVAGDTLWDLAAKYLGDPFRWPEIAELNDIDDPRKLQIGTVLKLPSRTEKASEEYIEKPYSSNSQLPPSVRDNLPEGAQSVFRAAFNSALEQYGDETRAFKVAWAAVRRAGYKQDADGNWVKKEEEDDDDVVKVRYGITKANSEKRYTLGPVYLPGKLDAHNEYIEDDDLHEAIWKYVKKDDRRIHLQHSDEIVGEWVEIMRWPYEATADLHEPQVDGSVKKTKMKFPAGTVYMGVLWQPRAWDLIKTGKVTGYSIGGKAQRMEVEFK